MRFLHARRARCIAQGVGAAGCGLLCASLVSSAAHAVDDVRVDEELRRVNERIEALEQQLGATRDALEASESRVDAQATLIERAGLAAAEPEPSGAARFLQQTEFEGWVSTSYLYNFNDPAGAAADANRGNPDLGVETGGIAYPFYPDHNSFQLDQLWFRMRKPATSESRGGFVVDIVYGKTADQLAGGRSNGNLPFVFQAYAEYLAPLGEGVRLRGGRFDSPIGVEADEAPLRFNITTGLVGGQLHPTNHLGGTADTRVGPVRLLVGVANDAKLNLNTDVNDGKVVIFGVGLDLTETLAFDVTGLFGDDSSQPDPIPTTLIERIGIVDAAIRWNPSDALSTWLEFTYLWTGGARYDGGGGVLLRIPGRPRAYGLAAASRYAMAERTGFSVRAEGLWGRDNLLDPTLTTGTDIDHTLLSLTGTVDHSLTPNLVVRVEGRWDRGRKQGSDAVFFRDDDPLELRRDQYTAAVEASYRF